MQILDTPSDEVNNPQKNEWALYLKKQESHYIKSWDKFSKGEAKISFNLGAAIGGTLWAGYRKIYWPLPLNALLFMIQIPLGEHFPFFKDFPILIWLIILGNPIFFGLWGDFLYYKSATKEINKALQFSNNKEKALKELGGVNWAYFIFGPLMAITTMVILLILFMFTGLATVNFGGFK